MEEGWWMRILNSLLKPAREVAWIAFDATFSAQNNPGSIKTQRP
jgi:hypothetical protein